MANSRTEKAAPGQEAESKNPVRTLVTYQLKKGMEAEFITLLAKHWPTLDRLGFVSKEKPLYWRALDKREHEKVAFIEFFAWRDAEASDVAHQMPEVMAIWEPMGPILEGLQLQVAEPLDLGH